MSQIPLGPAHSALDPAVTLFRQIPPRPAKLKRMAAPVTSEMLAQKLGLSRATVSIVLRGDAERRKISAKTAQRVIEAARELNYVPNQAARSLRRQRSDVLGVILPDFRLDWAENVMDGMFQVLDQTDYSPFVSIHRFSPDLFRKEVLAAVTRRDEALICFPLPGMAALYEQVRSVGIPLLFIGDRPLEEVGASWAIWDAAAAAEAAVRHLVEVGCERIGFLGFDFPMAMSQARYDAYVRVLAEAGLPLEERWISMPSSERPLKEIVESGLDKLFAGDGPHPDGLYVLNDGTALPALESLRRRGIRTPDDVAVVSMGDVPLAGLNAVGLSTMREPLQEMGRAAAEAALTLIDDPETPIHRSIHLDELHARRTTVGEAWDGTEGKGFKRNWGMARPAYRT